MAEPQRLSWKSAIVLKMLSLRRPRPPPSTTFSPSLREHLTCKRQSKKTFDGPSKQVFKRRKISSLRQKSLSWQRTTKTILGLIKDSSFSSTSSNTTNPRATRYLSEDGYPSFKTLDAICAHSIASGSLVFGTASSYAPVVETQFSKDEDHNETPAQEEHRIDDVVNDVRSRLNRLHAMSLNSAGGICGSSQSVGNGKRKMDTEEGEDWLKVMAQAIVESKTKPMAQFAKCIHILTDMGYIGREKLQLQMVLKDDIGLQTMFLENDNEEDRRLLIEEYMLK